MPPSPANVIAIFDSVTVSMAADKIGVLSSMFFVNLVVSVTSAGNISEYCGTNKTSSNARPSSLIILVDLFGFVVFTILYYTY